MRRATMCVRGSRSHSLCEHLATHRAAASEAQGGGLFALGRQYLVSNTATLCTRGCNPTCSRLQPYVPGAATLCA
eukprot:scaffold17507_cov60-Phaeocystis_antarctica.AAC.3